MARVNLVYHWFCDRYNLPYLSGETKLSQMAPINSIGNFILGGIIGGVIYSDSVPLCQYVLVLLIGVYLISLLNAISKHVHFFRNMAIGQPIPAIKKGLSGRNYI